jgi:preprotein translocase subunit SecD
MWGARVLVAVLIMVSAGCSSTDEPVISVRSTGLTATRTGTAPQAATATRAAAKPVELRQVVDASPEIRLKDRAGEELALGPVVMTMDRFNQAYVMPAVDGPGHVIYLELPSDLADQFAKLTTANEGKRLALVTNDEVIFAPEITGAIIDGRIQISGNYTKQDAESILASITGR